MCRHHQFAIRLAQQCDKDLDELAGLLAPESVDARVKAVWGPNNLRSFLEQVLRKQFAVCVNKLVTVLADKVSNLVRATLVMAKNLLL